MINFIDYSQLNFIQHLEKNSQTILDGLNKFIADPNKPNDILDMPSSKTSIKSNNNNFQVFGLLFHHQSPIEIIKDYDMLKINPSLKDYIELYQYSKNNHFHDIFKLIFDAQEMTNTGIINVFFSTLKANATINQHVNHCPYLVRGHLGLSIPSGNIGIKVNNEIKKWKEKEFIFFNPTIPHAAWNYTKQDRTILIVDFYNPEKNRDTLRKTRREQFKLLMNRDPMTFGMSGGQEPLEKITLHKKFMFPGTLKKHGTITNKPSISYLQNQFFFKRHTICKNPARGINKFFRNTLRM